MSQEFGEFEDISLEEIEVDETTGNVTRKPIDLSSGAQNPPKKITGSASGCKQFLRCPAQRYAAITKQDCERSAALVNGSGVHKGLELFVKEEKDPHVVYDKYMRDECEKNKISLVGPEAEEVVRDGHACIGSGVGILSKPVGPKNTPYYKTIDKKDVEKGFFFHRNGFKYVGSVDLIPRVPGTKDYSFVDYKTSKIAPVRPDKEKTELPGKANFELNTDLQFSMYHKGLAEDETPNSSTKGIFPKYGTWLHLRGISRQFAVLKKDGKYAKKGEKSDKHLPISECDPGKVQYNIQTYRTPEEVEDTFTSTIDVVMDLMDKGVWWRNYGDHCQYMCSYYDKKNERCGAEIPADHARKLREANEIGLLNKLKEKK